MVVFFHTLLSVHTLCSVLSGFLSPGIQNNMTRLFCLVAAGRTLYLRRPLGIKKMAALSVATGSPDRDEVKSPVCMPNVYVGRKYRRVILTGVFFVNIFQTTFDCTLQNSIVSLF